MKTLNTQNFAKNCFERLTKYVAGLKHGSTFKYVKGLSGYEKTLLNIIYFRGTKGEFGVRLTPVEAAAFGIKIDKDTIFCADVMNGKAQIIPLCSPEEFVKVLYTPRVLSDNNIEYVQDDFRMEITSLLDNALKFETKEEAERLANKIREYGKASGWVNTEVDIYEFEA